MRALALILLACPAQAWEFTPGLPCLLTHDAGTVQIALTYDPTAPLYTITVTADSPWPDAPSFSLRFDGPFGLRISTSDHSLGAGRRALSVADTGFGNVLNGLQFNDKMTAVSGDQSVSVSLAGAAGPVAAFRACQVAAGV